MLTNVEIPSGTVLPPIKISSGFMLSNAEIPSRTVLPPFEISSGFMLSSCLQLWSLVYNFQWFHTCKCQSATYSGLTSNISSGFRLTNNDTQSQPSLVKTIHLFHLYICHLKWQSLTKTSPGSHVIHLKVSSYIHTHFVKKKTKKQNKVIWHIYHLQIWAYGV